MNTAGFSTNPQDGLFIILYLYPDFIVYRDLLPVVEGRYAGKLL